MCQHNLNVEESTIQKDNKLRRPFRLIYHGGRVKTGVIYVESNIKMDKTDELYARLDQLITDEVAAIIFPKKEAC